VDHDYVSRIEADPHPLIAASFSCAGRWASFFLQTTRVHPSDIQPDDNL
jgi:hypothetical protein